MKYIFRKGYQVIEAGDGEEAIDKFYEDKNISLVILDVMMPKMNGWDTCRQIRKNSNVPIIMLTAKSDEASELNGFDCGADEYISKPFSPKILTARVDALIRRSYSIDSSEMIDVGGIVINKAAHIVKINDEEIELSFKEFELLTYFVDNKGIALSREKISGIGKIELAGSDEPVEWNILRRAINAKMSSDQFKINEDKLMGPFFLSKKVLASDENGMIIDTKKFVDAFKSKVIMYLYEDAVKQGKHRFFDGCDNSKYSSVCDAFNEIGMGIFGPNFKENFYDKQKDEA